MAKAFVGLGSNLGDRAANLRSAVNALAAHGVAVLAASSVYETDPIGPEQPDFLNAAVQVDTDLDPAALVALLKRTEAELGREGSERWGPRLIDLDLLLQGEEMVDQPHVRVPHPELTNRAFAMVPILEIDPDVELPSGEPLEAFCEKSPAGVRLHAGPETLLPGEAG